MAQLWYITIAFTFCGDIGNDRRYELHGIARRCSLCPTAGMQEALYKMHAYVHEITDGPYGPSASTTTFACTHSAVVTKRELSGDRHLKCRADGLQEALYKVHARVHETEDGPNGPPANATTRMLVCHTQAGCLIGK